MQFRTELPPTPSRRPITHHNHIVLLGSCFAERIGSYLQQNKFDAVVNPAGIEYNPISLSNKLNRAINNEPYQRNDLFADENHCYHSLNHPNQYTGANPDELLKEIEQLRLSLQRHLQQADVLIITLGTAYTYTHLATGNIVSNCHKLAAKHFQRQLMSIQQLHQHLAPTLEALLRHNPNLHIILTVSPIRHLKDGLHANQLSKATLQLLTHQLTEEHPEIEYYPAYELLLDDLRDYRFYADDLTHPAPQAVQYITEHFQQTYFTPQTQQLNKLITQLYLNLNHKPFNPEGEEYLHFIKQQLQQMQELQNQHPYLDFQQEQDLWQSRLDQHPLNR